MKITTIAQLFKAVQLATQNTSDNEELQKKLNVYGFTPKRIQEGKVLFEQARLVNNTQEQHYDTSRQLTFQIKQDSDAALEVFKEHVSIAKIAFRKEPLVIEELKIEKVSRKTWEWAQQAIDFYSKAPKYMERLQQYGVTQEALQQNKAAAEALLALDGQRLKKKGDAENSTQVKAAAIKALRVWYAEFSKLARVAFQETPQMLETYGIVILSSKRKRKDKDKETAEVKEASKIRVSAE